jgi:lambda family phage portal protein
MDAWGLPSAYKIWMRISQVQEELVTIPARDKVNRPQVAHIFEGGPDQVRGITPLAPALRTVRQYDQLSDATLQRALLRAIFAATVHSDAPTDSVLNALRDDSEQGVATGSFEDYLGAKTDWYQSTKIDLGRAGRVVHLFPGEKLDFHASETTDDTYEAFAKFLLREIARCLGMTFETLTGDYTGATYSSVRMATSEIWPIILWRRQNIPGRFYQMVFEAWLEEEVDTGRVPFPDGFYGFLLNREAACRADWRGPPKPQADDLKAAKAHETYKRLGVVTDEMICNDLGVDVEDVYDQRQHEKQMRETRDLPETDTLAAPEEKPGEEHLDTLDR